MRNQGKQGLWRLWQAAIGLVLGIHVGSQELFFPAFLAAKGDQVLDVAPNALNPYLRRGRLEAGDGGVTIPARQVRGLGALPNIFHRVSHPTQHVLSVGRDELELLGWAAVFTAKALKDIEVEDIGADGIPAHGEGTALASSRINAGFDGVFLDCDFGKANSAGRFGALVSRVGSCGFRFQPIDLLGDKAFTQVFVKSAESIRGQVFRSISVNGVGRNKFLGVNFVGGTNLEIRRRRRRFLDPVIETCPLFRDRREDIDCFGSGIIEIPRTSTVGIRCEIRFKFGMVGRCCC